MPRFTTASLRARHLTTKFCAKWQNFKNVRSALCRLGIMLRSIAMVFAQKWRNLGAGHNAL